MWNSGTLERSLIGVSIDLHFSVPEFHAQNSVPDFPDFHIPFWLWIRRPIASRIL